MVTTLVVFVPCGIGPKSTGFGLTPTSLPTPVRLTFCGVTVALSAKLSFPVRLLMSLGEKAMLTEQFAPESKEAPHVFEVCE